MKTTDINDTDLQQTAQSLKRQQPKSIKIKIKSKHVDFNDPKISSLNDNSIEGLVQCRICLQNNLESTKRLIAPCECTGSVMYVHQHCFTSWLAMSLRLKNRQELKIAAQQGMNCQICKMKFSIRLKYQSIFTSWQRFKQKVQSRKTQFLLTIFFLLLTLIAIILQATFVSSAVLKHKVDSSGQKVQQQSNLLPIIFYGSLTVLSIIAGIVGYILISQFGFTYRIEFQYKGKQIKTLKGILEPTQ